MMQLPWSVSMGVWLFVRGIATKNLGIQPVDACKNKLCLLLQKAELHVRNSVEILRQSRMGHLVNISRAYV